MAPRRFLPVAEKRERKCLISCRCALAGGPIAGARRRRAHPRRRGLRGWAEKLGREGRLKGSDKIGDDPGRTIRLAGGRVAAGDGPYAQGKAIGLTRTLCEIDASGPENSGLLAFIEALGVLDRYDLFHVARADLLRRLEAAPDAARAYRRVPALTKNGLETPLGRDATAPLRLRRPALRPLQIAAIVLTALELVPTGAHFFELPNKIGLPHDAYLTVQHIYNGWAFFGIALISAIAVNLALALVLWRRGRRFGASLAAGLLLALTLAIFFAWTYPANKATGNWAALPADWRELRRQWEISHAVNAALTFAALCLAAFSSTARE